MLWQILLLVGGSVAIMLIGIIILIARTHKKVPQGQALIRTGFGGIKVAFDSGIFVIPILHRVQKINIQVSSIPFSLILKTKDRQEVQAEAVFYIRVNKHPEDMVEVAQTFGIDFTFDQEAIQQYFLPKIIAAVQSTAQEFNVADLVQNTEKVQTEVLKTIGLDHNGYVVDDFVIQSTQLIMGVPSADFQKNIDASSDFTGLIVQSQEEGKAVNFFIYNSKIYIPAKTLDHKHILKGQKIVVEQ